MPPTKYAPDEIGHGMFLPRMIKSFHGGISILRYSTFPLIHVMPQGQNFLGKQEHFFAPNEIISATPKKKLNTPPCLTYENIYYKNRNKFY